MKTPAQWIEELALEPMHEQQAMNGVRVSTEDIASIQKESFIAGYDQGRNDIADMHKSGLNMEVVFDSINKTGLWKPNPKNLDCCATDQCKVTTETKTP